MSFRTPQQMLVHWEDTAPDHVFLRQPVNRQWREYTWRETMDQARRMAAALSELGLQPGDRVAIMSKNCAHWFLADFAVMIGGYVSVPIYPTANAKTIRYVLEHSESKVCFVGKLDDFEPQRDGIPGDVITIAFPYPTMPCTHEWDALIQAHEPVEALASPGLDETMTIIYTSGSTGNPKGAVHSYHNFAFVGTRLGEVLAVRPGDRVLSYLPLAHCTERAYVEATALYHNSNLYFSESVATFMEDLNHVRPTFFGSVPRLWKRFQLGIQQKTPPAKLDLLLKIPLIGGSVRRKIQEGLGLENARWLASGTAPIPIPLLEWWAALGMPLAEGWGMTESFAYGTQLGPDEEIRLGTISKPLPEVELRIGDNDEILMRCPSLMSEYYREPELTREAFTDDGFLKTGDCGSIDGDGYVRITGRAKEIFKTAKGKYVAPVPIESLISQNPLIEQSCVMGLGMPQPVALVQLVASVADREEARESLADTLHRVNEQLESHERLARFVVVRDEWTPENGLLTPTLKLKRDEIERRYAELAEGATGEVEFEVEHIL